MDERCLPVADLGDLCDRGPDDPRWAHVAACPRCRALVASYRRFRKGSPAHADPAAEEELARRVRAALAAGGAAAPLSAGGRARRIAWPAAVAVAAVLTGFVVIGRGFDRGPAPVVVRGPAEPGALAVHDAQRLPDGGVRLIWSSCADADSFQVATFDRALVQLDAWPAGANTVDTLSAAAGRDAVYWQVEAMRGRAVVARSVPQVLPVP